MSKTYLDQMNNTSLEVSHEKVESLWKQAMTHRSSSRNELADARANRAKTEMERQRMASTALDATKQACKEIIAEAERQLAMARGVEAEAAIKLNEAEKELQQSRSIRADSDAYREKTVADADANRQSVVAEAQHEAHRLRDEAREAALQECNELKRHVSYEVQCILGEIDTIRAAAQEEMETQRIYSEVATIQAMSSGLRSEVLAEMDAAMGKTDAGDQHESAWRDMAVDAPQEAETMPAPEMEIGQEPGMEAATSSRNSKKDKVS